MTTDVDSNGSSGRMRPTRPGEAPMTTPAGAPPPRRKRLAVLALVVAACVILVVVLLVQSLGESEPDPAPTAGPTSSTPSEPAPTPTEEDPPTAEETAILAAEQGYREYLGVSDEVTTAGDGNVAAFESVAIGDALDQVRVETENYRLAGITQVGRPELASLEAQSVSLPSDAGAVPEVIFDACLDLTNFDLVQNGESVIDPNTPDRAGSVVTVRNYPDRGGWLVASIAAEGATC